MSENIYGLTNLMNETVVEVIRRKFLLEAQTNPHIYDPIDVERCRSEGWQIERFLIEKGTPDEALTSLVKTMRWRKSFGVNERTHTYFPRELLQIFGHEKLSRDKLGRICDWRSTGCYRKIDKFDELIRQYCVFRVESLDREAGNMGVVCIHNLKGLGFRNVDYSLSKFSNEIIDNYPQLLKMSYCLDLPWLMDSIWKVMRAFMSKSIADKTMVIKKEQLTEMFDIDINELPISFGGNRELIFEHIDDMLPLRQCKHLNFTDKQINNFYKVYNFEQIFYV